MPTLATYAGARGRTDLLKAQTLRGDYRIQQKHDGSYCHVHLDNRGKIARIVLRSGTEYRGKAPHLLGAHIGAPWAIYAGELEAYTESANRAYETNGYRKIWLFDCLHDGQRNVTAEPYSVRRDVLYRQQSELETGKLPYQRDSHGNAHDRNTGKFVEGLPRDWRLTPIVEQVPFRNVLDLWEQARAGLLEGFVAVAQDAPMGKRRSKIKIKPTETLDALAVEVGEKVVRLMWGGRSFLVGQVKAGVRVGDTVELRYDGFYETSSIPKFARIVRVRNDLTKGTGC